MGEPIVDRLKSLLERPLRAYPNPGTLLDNYVILSLKIEHSGSLPILSLLEEREELERDLRRVLPGVSNQAKLLELVKELAAFHREMWIMEDHVRNDTLPLETRKYYAYEADLKNDKRAMLKTEINKLFGYKPGSEAKIRTA